MTLDQVHVFHVETDFIVAFDQESAVTFFVEMVGEDDVTAKDTEVSEIPRDRWPAMEIQQPDEPGQPTTTFQAAIEDMLTRPNQEYPKVLASSEY